jgi:F-type H+-transporting ATPase subunit epsilon
MKLKVFLPTEVLVDEEVSKVTAEAEDGSFSLLPRHVDFVAALVPGILYLYSGQGEEFLALDGGILVKCSGDVMVSTRKAVKGENLGELRQVVEREFRTLDDREKKTRSVLAKLEADFARRFIDLRGRG